MVDYQLPGRKEVFQCDLSDYLGLVLFIKPTSAGHEIAPNRVANATKIILLATKIQKLVAKFGFCISYLDVFCI